MNKKIVSIMLLVAFLVPFVPQTKAFGPLAWFGVVAGTAAVIGIGHHVHKKHHGESTHTYRGRHERHQEAVA